MIESAPYWWVTCDAANCDNRCPGPEYEHTAWAELSGAVASAEESDWRRDPDGKWFCDEHPRCETCSEPIDDPALAWVEGVAYHRACLLDDCPCQRRVSLASHGRVRELDAPRRARIRRMTTTYHRRKRGWKT